MLTPGRGISSAGRRSLAGGRGGAAVAARACSGSTTLTTTARSRVLSTGALSFITQQCVRFARPDKRVRVNKP
jgi:hypothetical protein